MAKVIQMDKLVIDDLNEACLRAEIQRLHEVIENQQLTIKELAAKVDATLRTSWTCTLRPGHDGPCQAL